jgi:hypothetical protein
MAKEYTTKADALEEGAADAPPAGERMALPDLESSQAAVVRLAPNAPEPPAEC